MIPVTNRQCQYWVVCIGSICCLLMATSLRSVTAQDAPDRTTHVGVVVDAGNGTVETSCLELGPGGQADGVQILAATGFTTQQISDREEVRMCMINNQGCRVDAGEACFCQCDDQTCYQWIYYELVNDTWQRRWSASSHTITPGMLVGWVWADTQAVPVMQPALRTFEQVCASATPTPTASPTATHTSIATETATPTETATSLPEETPTATDIPIETPTPTVTETRPTTVPDTEQSAAETMRNVVYLPLIINASPTNDDAFNDLSSNPYPDPDALPDLPDPPEPDIVPTPMPTPTPTLTPSPTLEPTSAIIIEFERPTMEPLALPELDRPPPPAAAGILPGQSAPDSTSTSMPNQAPAMSNEEIDAYPGTVPPDQRSSARDAWWLLGLLLLIAIIYSGLIIFLYTRQQHEFGAADLAFNSSDEQ